MQISVPQAWIKVFRQKIQRSIRTNYEMIIVISCLLSILWFLAIRISANYNWPPEVYKDPEVYNLTKEKILWDVHYGDSPVCQEMPCFLTESWPKETYLKQMVLPAREFPLQGFKPGQKIYARTLVLLPKKLLDEAVPIVFHSTYIFAKKYVVYINNRLLDEGESTLLNITIPRQIIPPDGRLLIAVFADPGDLPYQGLAHRGDIVIGPKSKLIETIYLARDILTNVHLWFMLPTIAFCVMFIFLYTSVFRNKELFYFILYAFLEVVSIFLRSGFSTMMLPWIKSQEMIGMAIGVSRFIMLLGFFATFFRVEKAKTHNYLLYLSLFLAVWTIGFLVLPQNIVYHATDLVLIGLKPSVLLFASLAAYNLYKLRDKIGEKGPRIQFALFLAYFLSASLVVATVESLLMALDFFGYNARSPVLLTRGIDLGFIFVLAAFNAVEIGYEISSKQRIQAELKVIEERLTLAQSIQEMLLPSSMEGEHFQIKYKFFYEPAGKLSGDWLSVWQKSDELHLLLGDVVGKGPQASLAVAVIATTIDDCKLRQTSLDECLIQINLRIRNLFHGNINTTFSSLSLLKGGACEIRGAASPGWFLWKDQSVTFIPMRGRPLGMGEHPEVDRKTIIYSPGMKIFTFTDGVVDTSKGIKVLTRKLQTLQSPDFKFDELHKLIIQIGKDYVHDDDKTLIIASA